MRKSNCCTFAILSVLIFYVAMLSFSRSYFVVDSTSPDVSFVRTAWWGLHKEEHVIKWMRTSDYDTPGWMTKGRDGKWYLFLYDDPRELMDYEQNN